MPAIRAGIGPAPLISDLNASSARLPKKYLVATIYPQSSERGRRVAALAWMRRKADPTKARSMCEEGRDGTMLCHGCHQ